MKGVFITLEGGEGAGKSTAARRLAAYFQEAGREVVLTREPGGTAGAETIRAMLLNPDTKLTPLADTMLHFAARADHVGAKIRPALAAGAVVVCDRFYDSTMAYQGYGMGVDRTAIAAMIALMDLIPDITFMLEVPEATAKQRLAQRGDAADRYDLLGPDFMVRIADGFRDIAAHAPDRCVVIDAAGDADSVFAAILSALTARGLA